MSRWCHVLTLATLLLSCGPRPDAHEPKPPPDDESPDLQPGVQFVQTLPAIPAEVLEAMEAQRDKVVPQPPPLGETPFKFPAVHAGKLKNGLRWYLVPDGRLPVTSLNLVVRAGTAHDPAELPGLSVFTGDMLREGGTQKRSATALADDIETLGAELSVITGADYTLVAIDSLSDYTAELLELMSEMVREPAFAAKELEMFRQREINRLELSRSDPEWIADYVFLEELYGDHPYSRYDTTREALEAMTVEDVSSFHVSHYSARNSFFVAAGDLDPATFGSTLEKAFGAVSKGAPVKTKWPSVPSAENRRVVVVDRPGSAQTVIRVGNTTLPGKHPDSLGFMVANHVLGGNASSRLFMTLREEKGLTYGCYSHVPMRVGTGVFFVETSTKTPSTGESLEEIFHQVEVFLSGDPDRGGVTEAELSANKSYLTGVLAIKAQTPAKISDLLIDRIVYGLPDSYYDTYAKKVASVTTDDVHALASRYIHPETALVVLVGDAAQIGEAAAKWGDVKVIAW